MNANNNDFLPNAVDSLSPNNLTLLGAMHSLFSASRNSQLDPDRYNYESNLEDELNYLTSRIGISNDEAVLMSVLCEKGANQKVSLYNIGQYLGCGNIEILQFKPDIDTLVKKGLVVENEVNSFFIPLEVQQAFSRNKVWSGEFPVYTSDAELYEDIFERFAQAADNGISKLAMHNDVLRLLETNSHLHFAKVMADYRAAMDEDDFVFLLSLACLWLVKGAQRSPFARAASVLRDSKNANRVLVGLLNGSSPLLTRGIVVRCKANSFDNKREYALSNDTKQKIIPENLLEEDPLAYMMLTDDDSFTPNETDEVDASLLSPDKIVKRPLFYNAATARQVEELATLLNEKKMNSVLRRLKSSGLRCGFTCLFHGGPGTGKTETIMQLARRTGRAVFQVEISQLRSKWHGESEKLVKKVFDDYRKMVAESSVAPILLFNEADAIFTRRMEEAERSIDKSENALQNIILQEMENLDGILIATTNLVNNLDEAFERRFLYKIEFETPDTDTRAKIWHSMMPALDNAEVHVLSEQFPDLVGGHIENITRKATVNRVLHGRRTSWDELTEMCRQELLSTRKHNVVGFRSLSNQ